MEYCALINPICPDSSVQCRRIPSGVSASATVDEACVAAIAHVPIRRKSLERFQGDDMAKKATARKPNAAFMKPMTISAKLGVVIGTKPMPRTEVTKKLWAYIKKNGLQDKKNKRMIKADEPLKAVFGGKATVNMFEMTKLVSKHLK